MNLEKTVTRHTASPVIFALESHPLLPRFCDGLNIEQGKLQRRSFPDGESYLRIETAVINRSCMVLADLSHPDEKYLPLIFLITTLRELGASSVGLVAPYLGYMRQDRRFIDGEAVTSRIFARQLSQHIDWLVTVDPHLHRYHSLDEIYTVPTHVVQGAPALAQWLKTQNNLFLVGPDAESEQWVSGISAHSGHPFIIGSKQRHGDREVEVCLPDVTAYKNRAAVIIDDVISSGQTILQCIRALRAQQVQTIQCAAVHGIFADNSDTVLLKAGLSALITTNTIPHASNTIDVSGLLQEPVRHFLQQ